MLYLLIVRYLFACNVYLCSAVQQNLSYLGLIAVACQNQSSVSILAIPNKIKIDYFDDGHDTQLCLTRPLWLMSAPSFNNDLTKSTLPAIAA